MKPNILIFCSWLDINSKVGIFFVEQAELIADNYNPILVVFKQKRITRKTLNFFDSISINENKTKNGLLVLEVYFPFHDLLSIGINDYFKQKTIKYLHFFLKERGFQVLFIHAQSLFDGGIWAYQYSKIFKTKYLITEHNQLSFFKVSIEKCNLVKQTLDNSVANLVVSNDKIRQFVANGLIYDFENIGNLINKKFYYEANNLKDKKFRIITNGAFTELKNQETILRALEIVDQHLTYEIEFFWIGYNSWGFNQDKNVQNLLNNFHYKNIQIVVYPLLERDEVAFHLKNSHLFIFSSLSEGMPVSVLEALACGLPVFSSNCGGVDEVIHKENGAIFQIKDFQKLSQLIVAFLNHNLHYNRSVISKEILERFGEDKFRENLLSIYNRIK